MNRPLDTDIRAEVWLARQEHPNVVVRPLGTFARAFSPDVVTVADVVEQPGRPDTRYVDISREGFYDMLPEALFHPSGPADDRPETFAERSKRLRQEEKRGRQFWLPAEQEMMRLRVRIEQHEHQTLAKSTGPIWRELFDWLLVVRGHTLTEQQQVCLLSIWMNAHRVVGNWSETATYFRRFLQVPVHITYGSHRTGLPALQNTDHASPHASPRLGDTRVGIDWILPTTDEINDYGGVVQLAIGPLTPSQLVDYLPTGRGWRHIDLLAGYLLPADADYVVVPLPETSDTWFTLAGTAMTGRLGMTTCLHHANAPAR
ncbi:hypothetical protein [Fibrella arboris]|uniref:hypothetical protein n=1 Tax=Fibrella arboris TaxID=3242486 RepID=UPI003522DB42